MNERHLTISQHLEEARRRLFIAALALLVSTGIAFAFYRQILRLLMYPGRGFPTLPQGKLVFIEITEMLGSIMKVSLLGGLVLALPVILYQVVMFAAPGLTGREKRYLFSLLPASLLAFVGGIAFGFFVLLPPALKFLLTFGSDLAQPQIRVGNYINLVVKLLFWMGLVFETPLVMFFLAKIGVLSPRALARARRYAVVGAFILGALITPTFDPINQTLVALPLVVLYELGIWLARLARAELWPWRKKGGGATSP